MAIFDPWKTISGAICLNGFINLVEKEPEKIDDLLLPLCCGLYLSDHWDVLNFSKTDSIADLRPYVSEEIMSMKTILLADPDNLKKQVNYFLDHLNGSLAFSVIIVQALYNGNQDLYKNNLKSLFQDCFEVIFWFIQDLENDSVRSLVCDFTDQHIDMFNQVSLRIKKINPM